MVSSSMMHPSLTIANLTTPLPHSLELASCHLFHELASVALAPLPFTTARAVHAPLLQSCATRPHQTAPNQGLWQDAAETSGHEP